MLISACKTTRIFCRPNCPPGRRTLVRNRVYFSSFDEARQAGYRPCKVCKPLEGEYGPWRCAWAASAASRGAQKAE